MSTKIYVLYSRLNDELLIISYSMAITYHFKLKSIRLGMSYLTIYVTHEKSVVGLPQASRCTMTLYQGLIAYYKT